MMQDDRYAGLPGLTFPDSAMEEFSLFVVRQTGMHFPRERWPDLSRAMAAILGGGAVPVAGIDALMQSAPARTTAQILATHFSVGETYFFREPALFDALEHEVLPSLIAARRNTGKCLRIWSAGCCTGEELYSIAILLQRTVPDLHDWNLTLLGTDIHPQFLHKARLGVYRDWSFRNVPGWIRQCYFQPVEQGGYAIVPGLRRGVTFEYLNLATDVFPGQDGNMPPMDIVLCRNVLMYFESALAAQVVDKLHRALAVDGWLAVGAAETGMQAFLPFDKHQFCNATLHRKSESGTPPASVPAPTCPVSAEKPAATAPSSHGSRPWRVEAEKPLPSFAAQARRCADQGLLHEADRLCRAAIGTDKCDPALRYLHALILDEQGQLGAAAEALNQALYLDPSFVLAHYMLGNLCRRQSKEGEADKHFANAAGLLRLHALRDMLPASDGVRAAHLSGAMGFDWRIE
jgi:chemotaxis protein methyltransferase CheR